MRYVTNTALVAFALFVGVLALQEIGRRFGRRQIAGAGEAGRAGLGAIEGAVFALMGLLVAFTFSGAASRFDVRRQLIAEEANAIGTAWLRLDVLPADAQPALRDAFRRYLDARIEAYRKIADEPAAREALARAEAQQRTIWSQALAALPRAELPQTPMLVLPALNDMIDITTTRLMATQIHPPRIVYAMLVGVALAASLFGGYAAAERPRPSLLHLLGFAFIVALSLFVILDLEYPRLGLIQVEEADRMLIELRASMG